MHLNAPCPRCGRARGEHDAATLACPARQAPQAPATGADAPAPPTLAALDAAGG
jgi:hypothetical protein